MDLRVRRGGGKTERGRAGALIFAALLMLLTTAMSAQTVYRWEDDRGVVHFSDAPPPNAKNVEKRSMPRAPKPSIRGSEAPSADASDQAKDGSDAPEAKSDEAETASGPARVQIKQQDVTPVGDSTSEFSGEVENVGGSPASDVAVIIEVTETNQGAECFREEVAVSPSSLGPGEKGTYSVTLTNPCLFGPIATTVQPEWN